MRTEHRSKRDGSLVGRAESALSDLKGRATGRRKVSEEASTLVDEAMSRGIASIEAEAPVAQAAERMAEEDVGVLAVCQGPARLIGMITDRDIVVRVIGQGLNPQRLTAGECSSDAPATASPQETLKQAKQRMEDEQVRRLPVVQGGRLVGIVSQADLAAHGSERAPGQLLQRLARRGGDRRSARWLLRRPYS